MTNFGEIIKKHRISLGLRQVNVQEKTGLRRSILSKYETGASEIPLGKALLVAEALGLQIIFIPKDLHLSDANGFLLKNTEETGHG